MTRIVTSWKLLGNTHLPPTINKYWQYDDDSWANGPKAYQQLNLNQTWAHGYYDWLAHEESVPKPLMVVRGGLSEADSNALVEPTLQYPDMKSETIKSLGTVYDFASMMRERNMPTRRTIYQSY
jgi:hypothetical protein